ncbi:hypothetical protein J6590_107993, partial [Homalodisca vitripennis]
EVRAKKPSLTLNLGTNGLKVTSEPPPMAGGGGNLGFTVQFQGYLEPISQYTVKSHIQPEALILKHI